MNMKRTRGFTLIELLVVIAVIAVLMAVLIPALQAAKQHATGAVCTHNQKSLILAWQMYTDDNDESLVSNLACYEKPADPYPWVYRPKNIHGQDLANVANVTNEDRFRGIKAGTLWEYVNDLGAYHCPGDNRKSTRVPPMDAYRSYSISYGFGKRHGQINHSGYRWYEKRTEVKNPSHYYVFVEEEHNATKYGENEGGWYMPFSPTTNNIDNPESWTFYDPLASYHLKSSTFNFADGHAERIKWSDRRTLEFIDQNAETPGVHSGITVSSPGNLDLRWLLDHFIERDRRNI